MTLFSTFVLYERFWKIDLKSYRNPAKSTMSISRLINLTNSTFSTRNRHPFWVVTFDSFSNIWEVYNFNSRPPKLDKTSTSWRMVLFSERNRILKRISTFQGGFSISGSQYNLQAERYHESFLNNKYTVVLKVPLGEKVSLPRKYPTMKRQRFKCAMFSRYCRQFPRILIFQTFFCHGSRNVSI